MIPYADFLYFGVLLYAVVPALILGLAGRSSRRWILIASLGMLAVQYGGRLRAEPQAEIREIWMLGAYALFVWAVAVGFLRVRAQRRTAGPFYVAVLLTLLPLIVTKYVVPGIAHVPFGFLGISYVTFRNLDVIFCIQDGLITALPPGQFLAYLFFFGTISSGPIDRYRRFATDWKGRRPRAAFLQDLDEAIHRIFTGFFYKFILAALLKQYWLDPVAAQAGVLGTLSYMYAYSLYLFFDFAGYSAFAIGVSYLFGIHTPENFNRPFLASNIRDFWNRWHITLSWWLRDHVYMRFVMAATKGRWFKSRYLASYLGLFLAFGLMGLWHGAAPNYLLYGLYHGALLSGYEAFSRWNRVSKVWGDGPLWQAAGIFGTFNCVCFGFLLFSGHLTTTGHAAGIVDRGARRYEGSYEKASCDEIGGWAWSPADPNAVVSVEIFADGRRLGMAKADLFRQDLADGGKGNGAHAFLYVPPPSVKDGWPHDTVVKISGTNFELSPSPRSIACVLRVDAMDGYEGDHESTDCERITGWASDATQPDRSVSVDIYDDQRLLGTVAADQFLGELGDAYGNGRHGFLYTPPTRLNDRQPHSISVRISGTNIALRHTPQILVCPQAWTQTVPPLPAASSPADAATQQATTTREEPPSFRDNGDGTISDLRAGLMWEKKVKLDGVADAANLHDADNCYPWRGTCATGDAECRVDADCGDRGRCNADDCQASAPDGRTIFQWVAQLNAANFAGHDDWRMPTSQELYRIVNPLESADPAVKAAANAAFNGASCGAACEDLSDPACSCVQSGVYWAASPSAPSPDSAWMMYFYCNNKLFLDLKSNTFYVRAVRGGG